MDEWCHWDIDDEPCGGASDCAFLEYEKALVPYWCARLTQSDRAIRHKVYGEPWDEIANSEDKK